MFHQILLSPQLKRSSIISNKHGIYGLPHELPKNLKLKEENSQEKTIQKILRTS